MSLVPTINRIKKLTFYLCTARHNQCRNEITYYISAYKSKLLDNTDDRYPPIFIEFFEFVVCSNTTSLNPIVIVFEKKMALSLFHIRWQQNLTNNLFSSKFMNRMKLQYARYLFQYAHLELVLFRNHNVPYGIMIIILPVNINPTL